MPTTKNKLNNQPKGKKLSSMKPKISNYYDRPKTKGDVNTKPSKTVPDQSMTISEIISRTQKGLPITGVRVPMYNETDDGSILPDVSKMDISEIYELKKQISETEKQLRKKLAEQQEEERLKQTEEYYKKKFASTPSKPQVIEVQAQEVK